MLRLYVLRSLLSRVVLGSEGDFFQEVNVKGLALV